MSRDLVTTTPEAAAQFEADRTPYYDERADRYEPDGYVRPSWPIEELVAAFGAMTAPMRCAHGLCRTSLNDGAWVACPHGLKFCEACVWEEACSECAA